MAARAGGLGVPWQVSYLSDEPLTDRGIKLSQELIKSQSWQHLVLCCLLLMTTGCVSEPSLHPRDLPHFGEPLPGTIEVTVQQGFERPGIYHLPMGACLGLVLDLAVLKPLTKREKSYRYTCYDLAVGKSYPGRNRLRTAPEVESIPAKDRQFILKDGDRVRRGSISW
jgi:hypothetical protein